MLTSEEYIKVSDIKKILTAYDIGKVVAELEIMSQLITFKDMFKVHENIKMVATDIATQIVKQGGVSDDVCEWKLDGVYIFSPHSRMFSCVIDDKHRYTYCPYCGKKIKVVE